MNGQEENEQEHTISRRITRNMIRQVIFANKNILPLSHVFLELVKCRILFLNCRGTNSKNNISKSKKIKEGFFFYQQNKRRMAKIKIRSARRKHQYQAQIGAQF